METSRHFRMVPYDLLTFIRRGTSGAQYDRLKAALDRLQSTTIATNIRQGERKTRHRFSWLNEWKEITDAKQRTIAIEFILPDWLYDGIIDQHLVLSIDPAYFDLTSGIERWLYRVVRKHAGKQRAGWAFTFRQLYDKSGSLARFSDFAIDLRKIVARQNIPEYWLSLYQNDYNEECLHFIRRSFLPKKHAENTGIQLQKRRTNPRLLSN
jgi:plasmid replication initiation protein